MVAEKYKAGVLNLQDFIGTRSNSSNNQEISICLSMTVSNFKNNGTITTYTPGGTNVVKTIFTYYNDKSLKVTCNVKVRSFEIWGIK